MDTPAGASPRPLTYIPSVACSHPSGRTIESRIGDCRSSPSRTVPGAAGPVANVGFGVTDGSRLGGAVVGDGPGDSGARWSARSARRNLSPTTADEAFGADGSIATEGTTSVIGDPFVSSATATRSDRGNDHHDRDPIGGAGPSRPGTTHLPV